MRLSNLEVLNLRHFRISTESGHTPKFYHPEFEVAQEQHPDAELSESNDQSHLDYIQQMLDAAVECQTVEQNGSVAYLLRFEASVGTCSAVLFRKSSDGVWYDFCKYQLRKSGEVVIPVLKTRCTPADFCKDFLVPKAEYAVLCMGKKSEVKKPEALRGIVKFTSVFFEKTCQCPLFLKGQDLYIKHGDYFSPEYCRPEDCGTSLVYRLDKYGIPHGIKKRFIYEDCWGAIVLRRVAWIRISNFISLVRHLNDAEIAESVWPIIRSYHCLGDDEQNGAWSRFLGAVAGATRKQLNEMAKITHYAEGRP